MKYLIASDIHGDYQSAVALLSQARIQNADKIILLGDILYHGPRNDLPYGYAPKKVAELLNSYKDKILCVRGNCDAEVDQMMLDLPILADYAYVEAEGVSLFITHGHKFNLQTPPPLKSGEVLVCGHSHVSDAQVFGDGNLYINPGSVAIPKGNTPKGYIILENGSFTFFTLGGNQYKSVSKK